MSSRPYFKLFFSDLVGDTLHLRDAEFGSYMLLLGAMWNNGGRLAADADRLARIGRCSAKVWARRWSVLSEFFDESEGFISSARMIKELQKVEHLTQERSAAGKKGVAAKALKSNNAGSANGQAKRKQPEPEPEPEEDISNVVDNLHRLGIGDWPEKPMTEVAGMLCGVAGSDLLRLEASRGLATSVSRLSRWKSDGVSWADVVVPVVREVSKQAKRPIGTWAYFDRAIAEAHNQASKGMPVILGGNTNGKSSRAAGRAAWGNIIAGSSAEGVGQEGRSGGTAGRVRSLPSPDRSNQG